MRGEVGGMRNVLQLGVIDGRGLHPACSELSYRWLSMLGSRSDRTKNVPGQNVRCENDYDLGNLSC